MSDDIKTPENQQESTVSGKTSDKEITFTVAQLATIISIVIGSIGTLSYAIASFIETRNAVNELKKTNEKVAQQISDLEKTSVQLITAFGLTKKDSAILRGH
jgi:hypothetical protein